MVERVSEARKDLALFPQHLARTLPAAECLPDSDPRSWPILGTAYQHCRRLAGCPPLHLRLPGKFTRPRHRGPRATFVALYERPRYPLIGAQVARVIRRLVDAKELNRLEDGP